LHFRVVLPQADHIVHALSAGLAPQGPGNGIEQGGFAMPVVTRQTGRVKAGKVERRDVLTITHEVAQSQAQRNHADSSSCSSCNSSCARSSRAWRRSAYSGWLTM